MKITRVEYRATVRWLALLLGISVIACRPAKQNSGSATAAPPVRNVRSFGAVGDGKTKDTAAFQNALDAATTGGEVVVPAGNYLIGSITLGPGVTLRLQKDATLTGSPDADDYPLIPVRWEGAEVQGHRALIYAQNADNIAILGPGGLVGGEGMGRLRNPRGPVMVELVNCKGVRLDGFSNRYARLWSIHLLYCHDVLAKNLYIRTSGSNSDGIDVDSSTDVRIDRCDIDTGDDCIALKSGRGMAAVRIAKPTRDVLITDCTLGSSLFADVAVGSEMSGGVRDVRIAHCTFTRGTNGIFIKSRTGRGGFIENISADDIDSRSTTFLAIELTNHGITGADPLTGLDAIPDVKDIHISNVKARCQTLVNAYRIAPEKPLDGFILTGISGTCRKAISLANIVNAQLSGIDVQDYTGPLLTSQNVSGTGLEQAVRPPATEPAR
jgi:polygalacturonase